MSRLFLLSSSSSLCRHQEQPLTTTTTIVVYQQNSPESRAKQSALYVRPRSLLFCCYGYLACLRACVGLFTWRKPANHTQSAGRQASFQDRRASFAFYIWMVVQEWVWLDCLGSYYFLLYLFDDKNRPVVALVTNHERSDSNLYIPPPAQLGRWNWIESIRLR